MRRFHLMEIHEQAWCPRLIRDAVTGQLGFMARVGRQYDGVLPKLRAAIAASGAIGVIDLCSGAGGPWGSLAAALNEGRAEPLTIKLTDLSPSARGSQIERQNISYVDEPVDATRLPERLTGFRTLFTSFHHFKPEEAREIVADAVRSGQGIAIFEQTSRSFWGFLLMSFLPLLGWLSALFVRPFRWSHFFWSFVLPVVPVVLTVDGFVSCARTYTESELEAMTTLLDAESKKSYRWDIGRLPTPYSGLGILYLIGVPEKPVLA